MSTQLANSHDAFFKQVLGDPESASVFLCEHLPPKLAELLAGEPPEVIPGSFVDEELRQHHSDLLFRIRLKAGGHAAESLRPYLPSFRHVLVDLARIGDEALSAQPRLRVHLKALKYCRRRDLIERIDILLAEALILGVPDIMRIVTYIDKAQASITQQDIRDSLRRVAPERVEENSLFSVDSSPMSRRINIMIDDDTWGFLGKVPAGERSRAIKEALREWVTRRRRKDAVHEMDALRATIPKVSSDEVARWVREDREQGH